MTDQSGTTRVYGEKEMRSLIKRATELQEMGRPGSEVEGISLGEVEAIAAELGIEPRFIHAAALEMEVGGVPEDSVRILRLPRMVEIDRMAPERMHDDAWPSAVEEIRRTFGSTGQTSRVGATYEWTSRFDLASLSLTPRQGETRIKLKYRYGPAIGGTMIVVAFYSAIGLGAAMENMDLSPLLEWTLSGGGFAGILMLARQVLKHTIGRHKKKLNRLAARLEAIVRGSANEADSAP